jgi:hypothetical protein
MVDDRRAAAKRDSFEVRASVSATMLLAVNLGRVSLGTLLPGLFDDHLFHGDQMLGRSMLWQRCISAKRMVNGLAFASSRRWSRPLD